MVTKILVIFHGQRYNMKLVLVAQAEKIFWSPKTLAYKYPQFILSCKQDVVDIKGGNYWMRQGCFWKKGWLVYP